MIITSITQDLLDDVKTSIHNREILSNAVTNGGVWAYDPITTGRGQRTPEFNWNNPTKPSYRKLQDYASGNQFGSRFEYYRGRIPADKSVDEIKRLSVMQDLIRPCLDRIVHGVLGRSPEYVIKVNSSESEAFTAEVVQWAKRVKFDKKLRKAAHAELWAGEAIAHVAVRPSRDADGNKILAQPAGSAGTTAQAFNSLELVILTPLEAQAIHDEFGNIEAFWHLTTESQNNQNVTFVNVQTPRESQRFKFENDEFIPEGDLLPNPLLDESDPSTWFSYFQVERENGSILTSSVLDVQDELNIANTYMRRDTELASFRTITTINAKVPKDATTNLDAEWILAPDIVLELSGIEVGEGKIATPDFKIIDPIDPRIHAIPVLETREKQLLSAFNQLWTAEAHNAGESADGQRQRRKAFDQSLLDLVPDVVDLMAFVIAKASQFAYYLSGQAAPSVTVEPKVFVDVSSGDLELFKTMHAAYKDNVGTVSLETVLRSNPLVEDSDVERLLISEDKHVDSIAPVVQAKGPVTNA
jgi:hypothetical protein